MTRWLMRGAWLLIALGGATTWGLAFGWLNPVHAPELDALPAEFGALRTLEIFSVDSGLLGDLPPDRFTFRRIGLDDSGQGQLYVAYYLRGQRWSGRPHDLEVCYRATGWESLGARELRTAAGASFRAQDFRRGEESVRVFHWKQQPGLKPGQEGFAAQFARMAGPARLRQDVASIYLQFPRAEAPSDEVAVAAVETLMTALETLWSGSGAASSAQVTLQR